MAPLQCYSDISKTDLQTPIYHPSTPIIKNLPFFCQTFSVPAEKGIAYVSFLVNHQARANALMPPVSLPTIMAGSTSGAKPAV